MSVESLDQIRLPAVGAVDVLGVGLGWHFVAYKDQSGNIVVRECNEAKRITRFVGIQDEMKVIDIPAGVPDGFVGQLAPIAFVLKDGRLLIGDDGEVYPKLLEVLRSEPDQIPVLTSLGLAIQFKDSELIEKLAPQSFAYMGGDGSRSAEFFRTNQIDNALRDVLIAARPRIAGDKYRGLASECWVHIADGKAWFALPDKLFRNIDALTLPTPLPDTLLRGFGLERAGIVNGGAMPHRWRPEVPAA